MIIGWFQKKAQPNISGFHGDSSVKAVWTGIGKTGHLLLPGFNVDVLSAMTSMI